MASPIISRAPQCLSCIRRITGSLADAGPGRQQIRGKKRMVKVTTVKVHLLQNVPGYGRRGAVIPVTPGMMRNIWFPKHMAEYVTATNAEDLGVKSGSQFEREYSFKSEKERKMERQIITEERAERERAEREAAEEIAQRAAWEASYGEAEVPIQEEVAPTVEIDLMTPEQILDILEALVPANIDIYRTRISQNIPKTSSSIASSATTSLAPRASASTSKAIYGSVSTSDIAEDIKTILQEDEEGSRVVLSAADISFVAKSEESDRVKHLGVFEIEIRVEGAGDIVRRTISIKDQN